DADQQLRRVRAERSDGGGRQAVARTVVHGGDDGDAGGQAPHSDLERRRRYRWQVVPHGATTRGMTASLNSRIERSAVAASMVLKLTCSEATSKPPTCSR